MLSALQSRSRCRGSDTSSFAFPTLNHRYRYQKRSNHFKPRYEYISPFKSHSLSLFRQNQQHRCFVLCVRSKLQLEIKTWSFGSKSCSHFCHSTNIEEQFQCSNVWVRGCRHTDHQRENSFWQAIRGISESRFEALHQFLSQLQSMHVDGILVVAASASNFEPRCAKEIAKFEFDLNIPSINYFW